MYVCVCVQWNPENSDLSAELLLCNIEFHIPRLIIHAHAHTAHTYTYTQCLYIVCVLIIYLLLIIIIINY